MLWEQIEGYYPGGSDERPEETSQEKWLLIQDQGMRKSCPGKQEVGWGVAWRREEDRDFQAAYTESLEARGHMAPRQPSLQFLTVALWCL